MSLTNTSHCKTLRAFSMIEALVALVILAIGLIGIARMLLLSHKANASNYLRQQAVQSASDIIDRIRANRQAAINGNYAVNNLVTNGTPVLPATPSTNCNNTTCSTTQLAAYDTWYWLTTDVSQLPNGCGSVATAPSGTNTLLTVTVQWNDNPVQQTLGDPGAKSYPTYYPDRIMKTSTQGFSLIELMVGLTIGLMLSVGVLGVYMAQYNTYKTNLSQASIQDAENAISALISPIIRSAGFCGCSNINQAVSNLNAGGPPPLGTLSTTPTMVMGYDAGSGTNISIPHDNQANDNNVNDWSPALDSSLTGQVQSVSDVLIVLGPIPGSLPIAVTAITSGSNAMTLQNTSGIAVGQFAAISDCSKTTIFQVTGVAGTTISHAAGGGALANASDAFSVNYAPSGAQFVSLTQTAFFVAQDSSGRSALARATLNANGTWTVQALVPNVESMQVLYGIGTSGSLSEYVPASAVVNWGQVYALRLGFLIEGEQGTGNNTATQYTILGTTITVPSDNRLRHLFEMTINLRNTNS